MRIRSQLTLLLVLVVAPTILVALPATYVHFRAQEAALLQRIQERVTGLRLAMDGQVQQVLNVLTAFADLDPLGRRRPDGVPERLQRQLRYNPMWSSASVVGADGTTIGSAVRDAGAQAVALPPQTFEAVKRTGEPAVSGLVSHPDGRHHYTYIAVPVLENGQVVAVAFAAIEQRNWLTYLSRFPTAAGTTLTLNDRSGRIIARTLNNGQWVGKKSSDDYLSRIEGRNQGAFEIVGLEGQRFYTAFSRMDTTGWVLGSGAPAEAVGEGFVLPAGLTLLGTLLTLAAAGFAAFLAARRIDGSLKTLSALASGRSSGFEGRPLPIREAEEVRQRIAGALESERKVRQQTEQLSEDKDRFLATLAHELRNPLNAMAAARAVLESPKAQPQLQRQAMEILARQMGNMSKLIDELLDVVRLSSGKVILQTRRLRLDHELRQALSTFVASGRAAHLRVDTDLQPAEVQGDPARLEQVFTNLFDNAAKFTQDEGRLAVSCRVDAGLAEVVIEDDGAGIDPAWLPRVFDPFAQHPRTRGRSSDGLGLGTKVAWEIVTLHGGTITAHSQGAGQGTRFVLRLPLAAPAIDDEAHVPARGRELAPMDVVLVDDGLDNLQSVATVLRLHGHRVATASTAAQGIALASGASAQVALFDIGLPDMSGIEAGAMLRASRPDIVLIALSGFGDERTRTQALAAGFDGYLVKPFAYAAWSQIVADAHPATRATSSFG